MPLIEDGMRRTARDFDCFVVKNVTMEWEAQKQRIFEHFGLRPPDPPGAQNTSFSSGFSAFGASSFGKSSLGTSIEMSRPVQIRQEQFAAAVKNMNDVRQGALTLQFSWRLLASITGESETGNDNMTEAAKIRRRVERGSRKFLEKQFFTLVEHTIAENPQIAKVGGIPSVFHKLRGFINVKLASNKDQPD
ncbi:nuclear pore complex subunit [Rhizina undulata]